ncbi:MAG: hypothetical protein KDB27_04480 [Planctomycetales bacterium]|nr:hypothetical protein [Planctomycetales bacterium]
MSPTRKIHRNLTQLWRVIWAVLNWMVLCVIVCAVAGGVYFYHRVDDELRAFIQQKASQQFPDLSITVGSARLLQGEGVRIRDVSVIHTTGGRTSDRTRAELLFVNEIFLRCAPTLQELLRSEVNVQHVHVRGATLRAERRPDGSVNLADLLPLPCPADQKKVLPPTTIEDATIQFVDRLAVPARLAVLTPVTMTVTPRSPSDPNSHTPSVKIVGSVANDSLRNATIEADIEPCNHSWSVRGKVPRIRLNPELYGSLPAEFDALLDALPSFRAIAAIDSFSAEQKPGHEAPVFQVNGRIWDGRVDAQELERPITDIRADFVCDERTITVKPLNARYGDSRVSLTIQRHGYRAKSPTQISISANRMVVNRALLESLPIAKTHKLSLLRTFDKFKPVGVLSGDTTAVFNGRRWAYDAEFRCDDMAFTPREFPYPVSRCKGTVHLTNDRFDFALRGKAGNAPVDLKGTFYNPGPTATGSCIVKTLQPLSIDDALIAAAKPKLRDFVRQLEARGRITAIAEFRKDRPRLGPMDRTVHVSVSDGWVNYDMFPYPISRIEGDIELRNDDWLFKNLQGVNDGCTITCNGDRVLGRPIPLQLTFAVQNIPLDHDLKSALKPNIRQLWDDIQPRGVIDRATVRLDHAYDMDQPRVHILAVKDPSTASTPPTDEIRIKPVWFSYPIESLTGALVYEHGRIRSVPDRLLRAKHQQVRVSTHLDAEFNEAGWAVRFPKFVSTGVRLPDQMLSDALPHPLAEKLDQLKFAGYVALDGELGFSKKQQDPTVTSNWRLNVDMEDASFEAGLPAHAIHGQVLLNGVHRNERLDCRGSMRLESIMHQNMQFTDVRSPLWFNGDTLLIGSGVPTTSQKRPPKLQARFHQGMLFADAVVGVQDEPFFKLTAQLSDANVGSIARDMDPKYSGMAGRASANLNLKGSAKGLASLDGTGNLSIREANLYELPLILALLKRLRHGDNDSSAFTDVDLAFSIDGQHVRFDRFDLAGEALTLKGTGMSGPQITNSPEHASREIALDFYSIVGRENMLMPILRPVLGEASRQFLLVKVRGTLENPQTRQEVLPGLNDAIRRAFPEATHDAPQSSASRRGILRRR